MYSYSPSFIFTFRYPSHIKFPLRPPQIPSAPIFTQLNNLFSISSRSEESAEFASASITESHYADAQGVFGTISQKNLNNAIGRVYTADYAAESIHTFTRTGLGIEKPYLNEVVPTMPKKEKGFYLLRLVSSGFSCLDVNSLRKNAELLLITYRGWFFFSCTWDLKQAGLVYVSSRLNFHLSNHMTSKIFQFNLEILLLSYCIHHITIQEYSYKFKNAACFHK